MDKPPFLHLCTAAEISSLARSLAGSRFAFDLEADSLHSYREKVCLVQLTTASGTAVLDALQGREGIPALGPVLADPAVEKVLHGADYDVRLLKKDFGVGIRGLFDTMVAAQLVGRPRVGLAHLLEEEFGVRLDKKYQRADWSARPLRPELLEYAALDTTYLLDLRDRLAWELDQRGRLGWAQEEFALLETAEPAPDRPPCCLDVKGAGRLAPRQLAVLQALLEVRDGAARRWDRPAFKVLPNELLLAWAQSPPSDRQEVLGAKGAGAGALSRLAGDVVEAVRRAQALPLEQCPTPRASRREPLDASQERRLERLRKARGRAAERLGIEGGLLVNSSNLERLARILPEQALAALPQVLKRWQGEAVGGDLRQALLG